MLQLVGNLLGVPAFYSDLATNLGISCPASPFFQRSCLLDRRIIMHTTTADSERPASLLLELLNGDMSRWSTVICAL